MALVPSIVKHLSRSLNAPAKIILPDGSKLSSQKIGILGEKMATRYLQSTGHKILRRNFKHPKGGEVDIVARKGDVLLFIEVKTRTTTSHGRPLDAVTRSKQKLIQRGAHNWLKLLGHRNLRWRFDVAEVILTDQKKPLIRIVENAF